MSRQLTATGDCNVSNESGTETRKGEYYSGPGASPRSLSYPALIYLYVNGLGANPASCEMGTGSVSRA
jgi:hypothetical protein